MKVIDLFAGVGGVRLGFERAGFTTVFANDFEPACKETYDLNSKEARLTVMDINKLRISELPEFDLLLGGFPCQAFSIAGQRKGFNDDKNPSKSYLAWLNWGGDAGFDWSKRILGK